MQQIKFRPTTAHSFNLFRLAWLTFCFCTFEVVTESRTLRIMCMQLVRPYFLLSLMLYLIFPYPSTLSETSAKQTDVEKARRIYMQYKRKIAKWRKGRDTQLHYILLLRIYFYFGGMPRFYFFSPSFQTNGRAIIFRQALRHV